MATGVVGDLFAMDGVVIAYGGTRHARMVLVAIRSRVRESIGWKAGRKAGTGSESAGESTFAPWISRGISTNTGALRPCTPDRIILAKVGLSTIFSIKIDFSVIGVVIATP